MVGDESSLVSLKDEQAGIAGLGGGGSYYYGEKLRTEIKSEVGGK